MRSFIITMGFCVLAFPAQAADKTSISNGQLQDQSDASYIALVFSDGHPVHYSPGEIVSGLKRHRQEWRARMIDAGFVVEQGQGS